MRPSAPPRWCLGPTRKEDTLHLKALRAQIKLGIEAIDRGDFLEIDDVDLDAYLERVTSPAANARVLHERMDPGRHLDDLPTEDGL